MMIEKLAFGRTGHESTRTLFGAAALGAMRQDRADAVLELLLRFGVNHIDAAASYGDAELRLAPWLVEHRERFFLATKTGDRDRETAWASIQNSLERMGVDSIDLIQLHNLTDEAGWTQAMGRGGALEAAIEAREQGLVRFIGVTGHGTQTPAMHLRSLEAFDFDSVLLPFNYTMMQNPQYAADFETLLGVCAARGVAVQTIKSIARRRWRDGDPQKKFSWYEPVRDPEALRRAVQWALARPGIFVNTSSDATLLETCLAAAAAFEPSETPASETAMAADVHQLGMEPLFVQGISDTI
jgi:aryl-alcohol dehydrogenase-like predicted oxidoreductase